MQWYYPSILVHPVCSSLSRAVFFFSCFRSCFSSVFCSCPVLHKVQVQFLETRTPSWQIGKLMLSFLMSQTLSELWLVPSNLMKSCLKPSHLKEKKEDWENHFTKEFYKLLAMHMRIFKKVKITWHCHMRQKNIMSQLTCPTALSLSSLVNIFSFMATCRKLKINRYIFLKKKRKSLYLKAVQF